jgi:hypothetical protein
MTDDSFVKTIGWIAIILIAMIIVVFVVVFGWAGLFVLGDDVTVTEQPHSPRTQHPSSSDRSATQPIPTTTPVRPEYNLQKSERDSPIYINYNADVTAEAIMDVCSEYKDSLVYIQGETDCNDMAIYLWNMLQKRGVKTLLVIGTPDGEYTPFADCDHAWLVCKTPDGAIYIEPTVPMVIDSSCVCTFRTQDEIDAYMERCDEESYREIRDDYPYLSSEEFDKIWRSIISSEEYQEMRSKFRLGARYIQSERPGDYSDFDYRQGYCYAKPSDMRKDLGERW